MSGLYIDQLERLKTAKGKELLQADRLEDAKVTNIAPPPEAVEGPIEIKMDSSGAPKVRVNAPKLGHPFYPIRPQVGSIADMERRSSFAARHALIRQPVRKIHQMATRQVVRNSSVMARLMPTLTSDVPKKLQRKPLTR